MRRVTRRFRIFGDFLYALPSGRDETPVRLSHALTGSPEGGRGNGPPQFCRRPTDRDRGSGGQRFDGSASPARRTHARTRRPFAGRSSRKVSTRASVSSPCQQAWSRPPLWTVRWTRCPRARSARTWASPCSAEAGPSCSPRPRWTTGAGPGPSPPYARCPEAGAALPSSYVPSSGCPPGEGDWARTRPKRAGPGEAGVQRHRPAGPLPGDDGPVRVGGQRPPGTRPGQQLLGEEGGERLPPAQVPPPGRGVDGVRGEDDERREGPVGDQGVQRVLEAEPPEPHVAVAEHEHRQRATVDIGVAAARGFRREIHAFRWEVRPDLALLAQGVAGDGVPLDGPPPDTVPAARPRLGRGLRQGEHRTLHRTPADRQAAGVERVGHPVRHQPGQPPLEPYGIGGRGAG